MISNYTLATASKQQPHYQSRWHWRSC